jgi:hypothetical protein
MMICRNRRIRLGEIMYDPFDPNRKYTVEEYLRLEELSEVRHEFWDGVVFPVGSPPQPKPIPNADEVFSTMTRALRAILNLPGVMVWVAENPDERGAVLFAKRTADGDYATSSKQFEDPSVIILLTSEFTYVPTHYRRFDRDRAIESVIEIVWIFADHVRAEAYKRSGRSGGSTLQVHHRQWSG